ncbi:MAG: assimilatory sulfite reductase (NADPH) flavoprotein subunit [Lautropia sp.]|nr:assimilatory sulfite reductase (NADPH) flavoprotein subunit [Lautropia sp.]
MTNDLTPLPADILARLDALTPLQQAWISGYCWSRCNPAAGALPLAAIGTPASAAAGLPDNAATAAAPRRINIISASQTGNARRVATQLRDRLKDEGLDVTLTAAGDYKSKNLPTEDILLFVTSTQGEGEPPEEAVSLHKYLFGKKAPKLDAISFGVLGLGDSSYPDFCQAGKDFDAQLEKLGGKRLVERGDCDLDFQAAATAWVDSTTATLSALVKAAATTVPAGAAHAQPAATENGHDGASIHTRENPFAATLSVRQKITAKGAEKDIEHVEIDLGDSGLRYQPGDALGVWPVNATALVDEILDLHGLSGNETVQLDSLAPTGGNTLNSTGKQSVSLRDALSHHLDITQITPAFLKHYAEAAGNDALKAIADDREKLDAFMATTPPVGVFAEHPHPLGAQALVDLFRPQSPRLYSIASAQDEVDAEVHLTVGVVQFEHHEKPYTGAASGYLGRSLEEGESLHVFVEHNPNFRLPADGDTPIIMIGAGTGVAPFRAFMQQRAANGDTGRNWLIFGNQRFTQDFLYQAEWLQYRKDGLLTRADLAWSRQGPSKVYVQHKLAEAGADIWQWLEEGAHIYVCGDASRMAKDVEKTLLDIIATHGKRDADDADEYLNELRENRRYQRDVY